MDLLERDIALGEIDAALEGAIRGEHAGLGPRRCVAVTVRNAVLEFGPSELLDTLVVDPQRSWR
jgi:hypothetical protein